MMAAMALSNRFFPCSTDVDTFNIFHVDVNSYITKNQSEELGDVKNEKSKLLILNSNIQWISPRLRPMFSTIIAPSIPYSLLNSP